MNIKEYMKRGVLVLDGGMGTMLQAYGLPSGVLPETYNITHPSVVKEVHQMYFRAGSNVISANTFGANSLKFDEKELDAVIREGIAIAKAARDETDGDTPRYIALDIGPLGRLLKPYGDLDFEAAVDIFKTTVRLGVRYGVDLVIIETMTDSYETKAALLAVKETCELPVFVMNAYGEDGKLLTGATPRVMCELLCGMGADAIGVNCSYGPKALMPVVNEYLAYSTLPVILKPNAGLPTVRDGKAVFDVLPEEFASELIEAVKRGVQIVGGCCGTTPSHIEALTVGLRTVEKKRLTVKPCATVTSGARFVCIDNDPVLIGERINPTGKARLKAALVGGDIAYILEEAVKQEKMGAMLLDVNAGLPDISEEEVLPRLVREIQAITTLPLQIDTSNPVAMERALRVYNGKALINSVNATEESMSAVFPLVKKYGGVLVALTLDENGIPDTASGRVEIAKRILSRAAEYGISKESIVFDPLCLPVSATQNAGLVTLEAVRRIREELGCRTSLGISNVSFGLPCRDVLNASFFLSALELGLSAAIINPYSEAVMNAYRSYRALHGLDERCAEYIEANAKKMEDKAPESHLPSDEKTLTLAITRGIKEQAKAAAEELLKTIPPMEIVSKHIVPALDLVGTEYEAGKLFLPGLLMSAEAAKGAFEAIKSFVLQNGTAQQALGNAVIATVKGDIHDIGKNIVKLLLENYGFSVLDLGRDVAPRDILLAVKEREAPLLFLSALMTTTLPAMEETVALVHREAPFCRVIVGGAVLTPEYADKIHADAYGKDAMEAVKIAKAFLKE